MALELQRTCISTLCPSPRYPSRIAVTTTNWSFATKFLTHRSYLAESCGATGWRSNFRAAARGRIASSTQLRRRANRSMLGEGCVESCSACGLELLPSWWLREMYSCRESARKDRWSDCKLARSGEGAADPEQRLPGGRSVSCLHSSSFNTLSRLQIRANLTEV